MSDATTPCRRHPSPSSSRSGHRLAVLDDQQHAVLRMLAHGHSVVDVALVLDLPPRDVVQRKYQIMTLLELDDDRQLVAFAAARGLLARPAAAPPRRPTRAPASRSPGRRRRTPGGLETWLTRERLPAAPVDEDAPTVEFHRSERPSPLDP